MLELEKQTRVALWDLVVEAIEHHHDELDSLPVSPSVDPEASRAILSRVDLSKPMTPQGAVELVVEGLRDHQVHNGHPDYFGLFNPATATMSIAADALAAAYNPQLAAWTHAPFACEAERLLLREIGARFGYARDACAGSFTTGGAEANHTALLMALTRRFPDFAEHGVRALSGQPTVYVSPESHHSFVKAARLCGLGTSAVRTVGVDEDFVIDPESLSRTIENDRKAGELPTLLVATLGTTGAGLIDPVGAIVDVGAASGTWVHADAAWGGAAALLPEMKPHFDGLAGADSITIDAHKWLSVPMAAGMFLTRHAEMAERTFAIDAGYMPRAAEELDIVEPHRTTMQWTRRFIGLKLFMTLLVAGWTGYETMIRNMIRLGDVLRDRLEANAFKVVNRTPLPVVCFQDKSSPDGEKLEHSKRIADAVAASDNAWVSTMVLGGSHPAIRACITNFRNDEASIERLVSTLDAVR